METKTINLMPDTQRDQWHMVVDVVRRLGRDMTREGLDGLCDELDRYIDHCEDIFDEMRKEEK